MKKIFLLLMVLIMFFCGTVSCQKDGKNSDDSEPIIEETVKKQRTKETDTKKSLYLRTVLLYEIYYR